MERIKRLTRMSRRQFLGHAGNAAAAAVMPGNTATALSQAIQRTPMPAQSSTPILIENFISQISFYTGELSVHDYEMQHDAKLLTQAQRQKSPATDQKILERMSEISSSIAMLVKEAISPLYALHVDGVFEQALEYFQHIQAAEKTYLTTDDFLHFQTHETLTSHLRQAVQSSARQLAKLEEGLSDACRAKRHPFTHNDIRFMWDGECLVEDIDFAHTVMDESALQFLTEHVILRWDHLRLNMFSLPSELENALRTYERSDYHQLHMTKYPDPATYYRDNFGLIQPPRPITTNPEKLARLDAFEAKLNTLATNTYFPPGTPIDDICTAVQHAQPVDLQRHYTAPDSAFNSERCHHIKTLEGDFINAPISIQKVDGNNEAPLSGYYEYYVITGQTVPFKNVTQVAKAVEGLTTHTLFCEDNSAGHVSLAVPVSATEDLDVLTDIIQSKAAQDQIFNALDAMKRAREAEQAKRANTPLLALRESLGQHIEP